MKHVQGMYRNVRSHGQVGDGLSDEFEVVIVHQGSAFSPPLFIIVLESLSWEFQAEVPWKDFYADDLVSIGDSMEECVGRLLLGKRV